MKKEIVAIAFSVIGVCSLIGCTSVDKSKDATTTTSTTAEVAETSIVTTEQTIDGKIKTEIYKPDKTAEKLITEEIQLEKVDGNSLFQQLQKNGVITKKAKMKSFQLKDGTITINFNKAFGTSLKKMGSAEENLKVQAMVKTFCENLKANELSFRVNGKVLETGHQVYDLPIGAN